MTAELFRLLESGDYPACLVTGRRLLAMGPQGLAERAQILSILCRCHLACGQFAAAGEVGSAAVQEARQARLRDLEGSALLDLATAQQRNRCYEAALVSLGEFFEGRGQYTATAVLEGAALHLQGQLLCQLGRPAEAAGWFRQAFDWFLSRGERAGAEEALLCHLDACLQTGEPQLAGLAWEEALRHPPTDPQRLSRLHLIGAKLHAVEGRIGESVAEAFQALQLAEANSRLQVEAQLQLSHLAIQSGRQVEALAFALAAQTSAIDGRCYPLALEAALRFASLLQRCGDGSLSELRADLERQGVDLYQYVDPESLSQLLEG